MSVPFYIEDHEDLVEDYREDCPGDSFENSWPIFYNDPKNFIGPVIHHTAGPDNQTVDDIANFHLTSRGWGGIGYHFVIDREGKIYYVGDLGTGRVHVAGLNDKYIGVCLIGSFMDGHEPSDEQLQSAHLLCKEFIDNEPDRFPEIDNWDDVRYHKELTSTACPGDTRPDWWSQILYGVDGENGNCEDLVERLRKDIVTITDERNRKDEKFEKAKLLAETFEIKYNREVDLNIDLVKDRDKWRTAYEKVVKEELAPLKIELKNAEINIEYLKQQKYSVSESIVHMIDAFFRKFGGDKNG